MLWEEGGGKMQKVISTAVIKRLPRYYRYLGELRKKEVVRISSKELSERMNVTASQIRQDLNNFGGFGQQGYGYQVEYLYTEIGKILGLDKKNNLIILGAGNLGMALVNSTGLQRRGFEVIGIFDVNPDIVGTTVKIEHSNNMISVYQSMKDVQVKENDQVTIGQVIGKSGTNSIGSELGNHLHFELYQDDVLVNPETIFNNQGN